MTPEQLRMARNAVRLGIRELAALADVAPATISRFESGKGGMQMRSVHALRSALEGLGIQFLATGDIATAPGVALRGEVTGLNVQSDTEVIKNS